MKLAALMVAVPALLLASGAGAGGNGTQKEARLATVRARLLATRTMLIARKKAVREQLRQELLVYEEKVREQSAACEMNKQLYEKNLISQLELENSERVLANTRSDAERIRRLIAEDDLALSLVEAAAQRELQETSNLPSGRNHETANLIRYNGSAPWSLAGVEKIARFYRERFGEPLPVSAMGQSPTHDRLGLDHRGALDVAVQPESVEGRELMLYLRKIGIPFIAFRSKVAGMSTGAHIHIGPPSPHLLQAKQRSIHPRAPDKGAEPG
jgi:hypothetical protein